MGFFISTSLGMSVGIALTLLFYRRCENRFDSSRWSVLFGGLAGGLVTMLAQVALRIFGDTSWVGDGLIPVGVSANPHSPLRELDALWRPGPPEIMLYVWLAGAAASLLWQGAGLLRFWRRVDRESRPAGRETQKTLERVLREMDDGLLEEKAYTDNPPEVLVMPSLLGPVSMLCGPKLLLLDREDYDEEALEAIFRHELVHAYGKSVSGRRLAWALLGAGYWFNPMMWLLRREARVREEYTCDREANLGCSLEKRQAYARAMTALATPQKREAPGTAHMACGAGTLRRRVEVVLREEKPRRRWQNWLSTLLLFALDCAVLACAWGLFSPPGQYTLTEDNLLNYVGQYFLWEDMDRGALTELEGTYFDRMETASAPYGAAAVYTRFGSDIFLVFPEDAAAADEACARLAGRLSAALESVEGAGAWELSGDEAEAMRKMLALDGEAALTGKQLGVWQGTTGDGHGFITLAQADAPEGCAVIALLWGKRWAFA